MVIRIKRKTTFS